MSNPNNPQGGAGRTPGERNPSNPTERNNPSSTNNPSNPSTPYGSSNPASDPSRSMQSQGSSSGGDQQQGDIRSAIRELAESIECLCGDASKRDEPGAKRHAEQARKIVERSSSSSSGSSSSSSRDTSRRDPDERIT